MITHSKQLISKHNLNKSTHISLNLKLKTLNNHDGKCSQPNDYTRKTSNGTKIIIITTMFWILKSIN
jgi:hypothetical protein